MTQDDLIGRAGVSFDENAPHAVRLGGFRSDAELLHPLGLLLELLAERLGQLLFALRQFGLLDAEPFEFGEQVVNRLFSLRRRHGRCRRLNLRRGGRSRGDREHDGRVLLLSKCGSGCDCQGDRYEQDSHAHGPSVEAGTRI
ncbi:hypothetical protein [Gemmata obscuriglobus]|uniref:hypothetical protein n=1 Tax=Gemmata obscuriglobus TaxID=114 RepID=UPI00143D1B7F|nr:hypothetical protein [Gemmata obscuriglobus]